MKATIHFWCGPATANAPHEAEDIRITVSLPFIPQPGMKLKLTPEGEFHQVDDVFWDIATPDELEVYLEEPEAGELPPWEQMQEQGWRIA